jgi:hypothetical protein
MSNINSVTIKLIVIFLQTGDNCVLPDFPFNPKTRMIKDYFKASISLQ